METENTDFSFKKSGCERKKYGDGIKIDLRLKKGFVLFCLFNHEKFIYTKECYIHT